MPRRYAIRYDVFAHAAPRRDIVAKHAAMPRAP